MAEQGDWVVSPRESQLAPKSSKLVTIWRWIAGRNKPEGVRRVAEHKDWVSFYWAFLKEFGRECYRTWRGEVLFSVVLLGFVYLINRDPLDLRTMVLGTAYSLAVFALWHSIRVPWKLYSESRSLNWGWGLVGIGVVLGTLTLAVWTAAWFYTMQPRVALARAAPDRKDQRLMELQEQLVSVNTPESKTSLRRRTLLLADEIYDYVQDREMRRQAGNIRSVNPPANGVQLSDADQLAMRRYQDFQKETERYYEERLLPQVNHILDEYQDRHVDIGNLRSDATQNLIWYVPSPETPGGSACLDALCKFRELAFHVDAHDQKVEITLP